jgi:7-keto-8-aminopelargonate synthetase-like enzyme/predicted N-acyltransferase
MKAAAIDAVRRYGTQFSSSRAYVSVTPYRELEELLGQIFNAPVILSSTTSLGHYGVIPILIEDGDAVIMDHQAHFSMQDTLQKLQARGIPTMLLRHSRLDELETKITQLGAKHDRIWYFIDGVYSMYGDLAPIREIVRLLDKHKQLHLYVDDAHGMGWAGPHGAGFIRSQVPHHPKMVLTTSLAKAFASSGGVFVMPNQELYWRVRNWGGPLTHSGPQQPAVIGASIASAKIYLSGEIGQRQDKLMALIQYCNQQLQAHHLPVIMPSESPIFFVGLGLTRVAYNLVRRLLDDGLYVNLGIFPAVPETCGGIRFTLTLHHSRSDIDRLIDRIAYHLPRALQEEGRTTDDIYRAFRSLPRFREAAPKEDLPFEQLTLAERPEPALRLDYKTTIFDVPKALWDSLLGRNGAFDWNNLALLEDSFQNNERREDNWDFHYYFVTDQSGKPVVATFLTTILTKNDMLAPAGVSAKLEAQRKEDFYYLTSRTMLMGTPVTEGQHLYLDKSHPQWQNALMMLLDSVWAVQDKQQVNAIYLRDFEAEDLELRDFFTDQGFVRTDIPDAHIIHNLRYDSIGAYLEQLTSKKRYHVRKDALERSEWFNVKPLEQVSPAELDHLYGLYENVFNRNFEINTFKLPKKFFRNIVRSPDWDVLTLTLKPPYDTLGKNAPVAVEFSYKNANYCPVVIGLDYDYLDTAKVYKQLLLQIVARAIALKREKVYFGLLASLEKRKVGAVVRPQVAYVQMKDNFEMSQLYLQSSL